MEKRRVVITGMGILSPLGSGLQQNWTRLIAGHSGASMIKHFDTEGLATRFAGIIPDYKLEDTFSKKETKKLDHFTCYAIEAAKQAMADSGIDISTENPDRIGVAVGSGIGGLGCIEKNTHKIYAKGARFISPFFVPASIINMAAGNLAILYGLRGPNIAVATACTTGTHMIGLAARSIVYGDADAMLAGGSEAPVNLVGLAGFNAARSLSKRNDNPQAASRPWDKDRDGFLLSEGAGILFLEEYEHAKKRNASIYAEIIGFGMSCDAHHITSPAPDGSGAALSMTNALNDAGVNPDQLDYINAHGTSTQMGDKTETEAVKKVFADHAYKIPISSTKSMTGHLLGAAGAIESIYSILAIQHNIAPPTINLDNPDIGCDLNYVPHHAQEHKINYSLSNSFGFGGTNGTLVFRSV